MINKFNFKYRLNGNFIFKVTYKNKLFLTYKNKTKTLYLYFKSFNRLKITLIFSLH